MKKDNKNKMERRGMNKKGISEIVVTTLVILLGIALVVILWVAAKGLVSEGVDEFGDTDFISTTFKIDPFLVDVSGDPITFNVERTGGDTPIIAMNVIIEDEEGDSHVYEETFPAGFKQFQKKNIQVPIGGDLDEDSKVVVISVVPIFTNEDGERKVGKVKETYDSRESSGFKNKVSETQVYTIALGPNQVASGCTVVGGNWDWDNLGSCGNGWRASSTSTVNYLKCAWVDTLPAKAKITSITVDPVSVVGYTSTTVANANWYLNGNSGGELLYSNDNFGGFTSSNGCQVGNYDQHLPKSVVDTNVYNPGQENYVAIYRFGDSGNWYHLNGGNGPGSVPSSITVTVDYTV
jgi:hypothetical protein